MAELSPKPKNLPVLQMDGLKWENLNLPGPLQQAASGIPQPPDWGHLVSRDNTSRPSFGAQPILPKIGILLRGWAEIDPLLSSSTVFLGGTWSDLYNIDHKQDKVKLSTS